MCSGRGYQSLFTSSAVGLVTSSTTRNTKAIMSKPPLKSALIHSRFAFGLILAIILAIIVAFFTQPCAGQDSDASSPITSQEKTTEPELLQSLGINSNRGLAESSGVSICSFVKNSIWTHNDSGHSSELFLLRTDGKLLAKVKLNNARNVDWEAMSRFKIDNKSYLIVGDVGDNRARRKACQIYLIQEPDLAKQLAAKPDKPIETSVKATRIDFTYPDGARNCEAIAVDVLANQIWLIEKIYVNKRGSTPPGIYVLPLRLQPVEKSLVAKRIGSFPPSNVTGMDFSPDGRRLIIRNYLNAHLYSRVDETWEAVIKKTIPNVVVLPIQRQGEAVCFTEDSQALILTSELNRQPIWQVNLKSNFEQPRRLKKSKKKPEAREE